MSSQQHIVDERTLHVTSVFQKTGDHAVLDHAADSDEEILVALGYKQEFKRDFSIWESFSVSFSVLGLLPSIASTLSYNLAYSGPAGSVWGWVVAAVLVQFVAFAMAELCSSMPTAGGLYYASAVLAPEGWVHCVHGYRRPRPTSECTMLTNKDNGLVELPRPSYRAVFCQLCPVSHDTHCR
jgi:hypothetical protein